ncbi:MAG TPA: hypothetical protein DC057_05390 [Spirochaetia bacterium]|nr:hypothetical protein [Spirochaetia bacterium]
MKIMHQTGFRYQWNITSILDDIAGDGLILSPVNINYDKLFKIPESVLSKSFFDPQIYLIDDNRGDLSSYPYHPANISDNFSTSNFEGEGETIINQCIDVQLKLKSEYIVIPTRYYESTPSNYFDNQLKYFTNPFITNLNNKDCNKKLLQTIFIKNEVLKDEEKSNELLNQLTSINNINGYYIIFEFSSNSKQLKDLDTIMMSLKILKILKLNEYEIHIGYTNTESVLFTLVNPDSISVGIYENLRRFSIKRFETQKEKQKQQGPRARLYSSKLFQFIDYGYISAIKKLAPELIDIIFPDSKYKPLMFKSEYNWHFSKPEPYMHYFIEHSRRLMELNSCNLEYLKSELKNAFAMYTELENKGIVFDTNSDGSHLPLWLTAVNMWEKIGKEIL